MIAPDVPRDLNGAAAAILMAIVLVGGYLVGTRHATAPPTASAPCVCSCAFTAPPPVLFTPPQLQPVLFTPPQLHSK